MQPSTIRLEPVASPSRPVAGLARRSLTASLLGLLLAAAGIVGVLVYGAGQQQTEPVLIVAREVPVGLPIQAEDLERSAGQLPAETRRLAIPAGEAGRVIGQPASRRLRPGTPLTIDDLASRPLLQGQLVALPVPLKPDMAPPLAPGNRVDVIALGRAGEAATAVLARDVVIQHVTYAGSAVGVTIQTGVSPAAGDPRSAPTSVILLVTRDDAPRIATAAASGGVALALLPDA